MHAFHLCFAKDGNEDNHLFFIVVVVPLAKALARKGKKGERGRDK
jgi:hypothetical protein